MFASAITFNQYIGSWDTNMSRMFQKAITFNQYIGGIDGSWNTGRVIDMHRMFEGTVSFNQSLTWNISSIREKTRMFDESNGHLIRI